MASVQVVQDSRPPADAYQDMITTLLPLDPDLEIEEQTNQTWHIKDWKKLEKRVYWPTFECGGLTWRVLIYPSGNNVDFVSLYLEASPKVGKDKTIVAKHRFHAAENDWGFTKFSQLKNLLGAPGVDADSLLLENGEANITAYVRVYKDPTGVLWENFWNYDLKKATGMVGLRNQGSTGYLNVVLQALYFITAIRKLVYKIPTREGATTDVAWALQRLFYSLQTSDTFVTTQELTKSFGWSPIQAFQQQDVVEMLQILISQLMTRAQWNRVEELLPDLFIGSQRFFTSNVNSDRVSSRSEDLYILSLNIYGLRTLQESLADYVKVDTFNTGAQHEPQEMKRGMIIDAFPPVLHLQLKRFQYDISEDAMVKLDDFFEFPEEIDLSPYLADNADRSEPWTYVIYGVVAHSGGIAGGQYNAFLRPANDGQFYKFDDERVTKATLKEAIHNNFGAEDGKPTKKPTAYLLIYTRKSRLGDLLGNFTKNDVPQRIVQELARETAEKARKAAEEEKRRLNVEISLISDETFQNHHGLDLSTAISSPTDLASPRVYNILGAATLAEFTLKIAAEKGLKSKRTRFWFMANRQNKTIRPESPLEDHTETFDQIIRRQRINDRKIRLYVEEMEPEKSIWPLRVGSHSEILLFLKHYNPLQEQVLEEPMRGVCHVYVRKSGEASELSTRINKIMNWPSAVQMILFEEIKPALTTMMDPSETFKGLELQDGDIIRFQRTTESLILPSSLADNVAEIRI
ncbi:hypothetical protein VF21_09514 [Pseudogymnoascus sp. 05NY08]|nr:hypothetical protein VF21_09514 [Pseudogymnoascus sp. 05NY08]